MPRLAAEMLLQVSNELRRLGHRRHGAAISSSASLQATIRTWEAVQQSRQYFRSRKVEKPETQLAVVTILHPKSVAQRPHQEIYKRWRLCLMNFRSTPMTLITTLATCTFPMMNGHEKELRGQCCEIRPNGTSRHWQKKCRFKYPMN